MLRITANKSAAAAKSYYSEGLSKQDYYSEKDEIVGNWYGKTATKLGLSGEIKKEDFADLCDNKNPNNGDRLTPRNDKDRTVNYDFTFSAKKSVSVLYALSNKEEKEKILNAFRSSVTETMSEIETGMQTRIRGKGIQDENRETGNLIYAEYIHSTSRPIDGVPDPHLHTHAVVFNVTHDPTEDRFKAGQFRQIKQDAPYYDAYFDATLADKLQGLGYQIEPSKTGWEIAGLDKNTIDKFSRRTAAIEKKAAEKGITSNADKDGLGALTRESKRHGLSPDEQKKEWLSRLTDDEKNGLDVLSKKAALACEKKKDFFSISIDKSSDNAKEALNYSIKHHLERKSVASDKEILATALKSSIGKTKAVEVKKAFAAAENQGEIMTLKEKGRTFLTSKDALKEEQKLLKLAYEFKGNFKPINTAYITQNELLSNEQKEAVKNVLASKDGLTIISGKAGTGKTTLMKEVKAGLAAANQNIYAFAPTAEAADVQKKEGFSDSNTVAALLINPETQKKLRGSVMWVDEAGMLSNKDMNRILEVAKEQKAKVILTGDTRQHSSVERGDALRILQSKTGFKTSPVTKIQRQKNEDYKQAVKFISEGEVERGFKKLSIIGAIHEIDDDKKRIDAVATDYLKSTHPIKVAGKTRQREVLVVSPTHAEGDQVTAAIREKLKTTKVLHGQEKTYQAFKNLNFTEAEKDKIDNYQKGNYLVFHQNIKGVKAGSKLEIAGTNDKKEILVYTKDKDNNKVTTPISLEQSKSFNIFAAKEIGFMAGDKIRITGNGKAENGTALFNGNLYKVTGFDKKDNILLSNGSTLSKDFGNIAHGYVVTSHASQGKTVDKVIISQGTNAAKAASSEQFYVSVSRGKEDISIYTDNKEELLKNVSRSAARGTATELAEKLQQQAKESNRLKIHQRIKEGTQKAVEKVKNIIRKPSSQIIQKDEQAIAKNTGRRK